VNLIVVLEPRGQQRDDGGGVRQDRQSNIIPFERFDEGLGNAVRFGRADRREAQFEAQGHRNVERFLGDVSRAAIGQPLDGMRRLAPLSVTNGHQRLRSKIPACSQ
jgi:hypothetical protein